ncbi:EamA family transporter RarD [Microbacterium sp. CFBP9034]|uniref:EamA family transporter RarD n=1 Tax=Microbacterium sp. CFBP9034 TaxID=3096540 RepID=UPI002A6B6CF9|nr:EamA family transporter RarD [Microbacterium sp. CFBP9034]MDY0910412.1 EamA family transporter RarD [Microbacterium sp. CFBP9034]
MPPASARAGGEADLSRQQTLGGVYAFSAYLLWGFLPLYFLALAPTGPFELVAWRILLSLVFCAFLLTVTRSWSRLAAIFQRPKVVWLTVLAGGLIYINWQVFMLGALTGHVVETSLGYFINPIATVLLAVLVLRERLRPTQWVAIGIAALAVLVIIVGYGSFPWIALTLAATFSLYGLVKKRVGPVVDAVSGLTLESLWLVPVAGVLLVVVNATTGLTMGVSGPWHLVLISLVGAVTAVPLLFFAAGARRASLTLIGLLQFVAPILQFVIGVWLLGEAMPLERWIGFGLVWVALIILTVDSLVHARRAHVAAAS